MAEIYRRNRRLKFVAGVRTDGNANSLNKPRLTISLASFSRAASSYSAFKSDDDVVTKASESASSCESNPKFGVASVCGRRREMEDTVAVHPSFIRIDEDDQLRSNTHYFGVFDGHGCSHVAMMCKNILHLLVKEELKKNEWKKTMERSFRRIYYTVCGVLAMSRAIGDNYLKPYVTCEPEVTIIERTAEDDCLILASDGLWDVVSNDTACGLARMCLKGDNASLMKSSTRIVTRHVLMHRCY